MGVGISQVCKSVASASCSSRSTTADRARGAARASANSRSTASSARAAAPAACLALIAALSSLASCHSPASPPTPPLAPPDAAPTPLVAPGLRLPHDFTPLSVDLTLEVDPESDTFRGHAVIRARAEVATDHAFLHQHELAVEAATADGAAMTTVEVPGVVEAQMHVYRFAHPVAAKAEVAFAFDYTGKTTGDQEGLFVQKVAGRSYLYAQSQAVFARRILPCFDEPGYKPTWRVTLVTPNNLVALSDAPQASASIRKDGRREVVFQPTPPMSSYLLSLAVGPFDLVEAGTAGRNKVPLRVAVPAGTSAAKAGVVAATVPDMVAVLERYFDEPLPLGKLDVVAVPQFFGAMENPGLITIAAPTVIGDASDRGFADHFARITAHELAHQWLGDEVTPAWWDDIWLSEAFATWLGDKITAQLGHLDDAPLQLAISRERALAADDEPDAKPLRRPVERTEDPDSSFDAISYEKGGAVLAMFEHFAGDDAFRDAVRGYVRAHRLGTVTAPDFLSALAAVSPDASRGLASYLDHVGAPVVDLELHCEAAPHLHAKVRGRVIVPVCVRYLGASGPARACAAIDGDGDLALRDAVTCPAWVTGNAGAVGYYQVAWSSLGAGPAAPIATQTPGERLVTGDDLAAAIVRGDVAVTAGLAEIRRLADTHDTYASLAALSIARAIDPFVGGDVAPRWWDYLAARFADRLASPGLLEPGTPADGALLEALIEMIPPDRWPGPNGKRARAELDKLVANPASPGLDRIPLLAAIAGPAAGTPGAAKLFADLAHVAETTTNDRLRVLLFDALGRFGPVLADRAIDVMRASEQPSFLTWPMVRSYLERRQTRRTTWTVLEPHLDEILAKLAPSDLGDLIELAGTLCDAAQRKQVEAMLGPHAGDVEDGRRMLDHALARIDRCISLRSRAGDVSTVLQPHR